MSSMIDSLCDWFRVFFMTQKNRDKQMFPTIEKVSQIFEWVNYSEDRKIGQNYVLSLGMVSTYILKSKELIVNDISLEKACMIIQLLTKWEKL